MSTSSSFTGFFATSIIDIYPELYINEKDEYDDTEFQELMKEFYKKETAEQQVKFLLKNSDIFVQRPNIPFRNYQESLDFAGNIFELMQNRENFYDILNIFLHLFVILK